MTSQSTVMIAGMVVGLIIALAVVVVCLLIADMEQEQAKQRKPREVQKSVEPGADDWEFLLAGVIEQGRLMRAQCAHKWPGMCDGSADYCGACNRVKR